MKKIILLLLFVLVGWQHAHAQKFNVGGIWYYQTSSTTVGVAIQNTAFQGNTWIPAGGGYSGYSNAISGDITIPAQVTYNSSVYTVTTIRDGAFYKASGLTAINLPTTITYIGFEAFAYCSGLTTVVIPNSITNIRDWSFKECHGLASVTLPSSATAIGSGAFYNCTNLTSVTCNIAAPLAIDISELYGVFRGSVNQGACTLKVPSSSIAAYQAAAGWQNFSPITCSNPPTSFASGGINYVVTSPTTVAVGNNQNTSGSYVIPASVTTDCGTYAVTSIVAYAFAHSYNLTSVSIPSTITSIGAYAFIYCYDLSSIICDVVAPLSIHPTTFQFVNQGACILKVPAGSIVAYQAASIWKNFSPIACPNSTTNTSNVTACGNYTWSNNGKVYTTSGVYTGLTTDCVIQKLNLTLTAAPASFVSGGINYVYKTATTVEVGGNAGASESIVIPSSIVTACGTYIVTGIGYQAFTDCVNLTAITIPNSVTSIGYEAFYNCPSLTSVTIPNSVTSIGISAFNRTGLTSIVIPNSVTSIGANAFYYCLNLTSATISNSVTSFGNQVLYGNINLKSITCNAITPVNISADVFLGLDQPNISLTVPAGSIAAYQSAPVWQNFSFIPTTKVRASQSGATLSALNTDIMADFVPNVTDYRFKVTIPEGGSEVIERGYRRFFNLTSLFDIWPAYNRSYTISVSVKKDGVWGNYGAPAIVTTPLPPTTKVQTSQCSATLAGLNTDIQADWLQFATAYRFKVVGNGNTEFIDKTYRYFNLTALAAGASYNTAYTISVAAKHNGVWGEYGTECIVTTPMAPTTKVQAAQCGEILQALNTDILADWLQYATAYRFKVVANGASYIVNPAGNRRYFKLTSLPVTITAATNYTISVAAQFNGVWGDYATECNVRTPAPGNSPTNLRQIVKNMEFSVITYPNPSNSTFNLHVNGSSNENVSILVFDITGRQIENKVMDASAIENISLGENYSAGIYNVIVSQGTNTKTVRLMKN